MTGVRLYFYLQFTFKLVYIVAGILKGILDSYGKIIENCEMLYLN